MKWVLVAFVLCSCAPTAPAVVPAVPAPAASSLPADVIFAVPAWQCDPPIDVGMSFGALSDLMAGCEDRKRHLQVELAKERTKRQIAEDETEAMRKAQAALVWRATWMPWIAGGAGVVVTAAISVLLYSLKSSVVVAH